VHLSRSGSQIFGDGEGLPRQVLMARISPGKIAGLVFGCVVVGVMLFMMFAVLGGLFAGGE
jgi:hypothetical protein